MSADKTAPTELQIKVNSLIRPGKIAWLDRNENPFAYTTFGDPTPFAPGRAAYVVVNPDDVERVQAAILDGRITY
jgi:hypothetical protein